MCQGYNGDEVQEEARPEAVALPGERGGIMFEAGQSGNPKGRPKGSYGGRIQALASLDRLLARRKNQNALIRALEKDLQANPLRFFKTVIMPLLPRESKLSFDHESVIEWKSLVELGREQRAAHVDGGVLRVEGKQARPEAVALPGGE